MYVVRLLGCVRILLCSLAERTGIRLGIKPKQVASLLLRSLDDRSRADLMEVSRGVRM